MAVALSLIGFGEAGRSFARGAGWVPSARAFDLRDDTEMRCAYDAAGAVGCTSNAEAIAGAEAVVSLVTADQALVAAEQSAHHITAGALFFDMNSVAPITKQDAAQAIEAAGGRYIDVAIMAPVDPAGRDVPLLLAGAHADAGVQVLATLGFANVRAVGGQVGKASSIKMIRSVLIKGIEALTAECMIAASRAGVVDEVLASLGSEWRETADYNLDRMMQHGRRRAAEMEEVVRTLEALGVAPEMTCGTVRRQREIGLLDVDPVPSGLAAKLERLAA